MGDYVMKRKMKLRPISVTAFVLEVFLFWILHFINGYAFVNGIDTISDPLRGVFVIGTFVIAFLAVLTIIQMVRDFKTDSAMSGIKKIGIITVFVVSIFIHINMYSSFTNMGYTSSGLFSITDKKEIGDSYYLYIKRSNGGRYVQIQCAKEIYDELIVDEKVGYVFSYRWLTYKNDIGVLVRSIDTTDFIDNRR